MWRVLRLVQAFAGTKGKNVLARWIAAYEVDLPNVDGTTDIESFELRFGQDRRRVDVVNLLPLDLREESNFRVEMKRGRGRSGADQDRPLEPNDLVAAKAAEQIDNLAEKHVDQLAKPRVAIFGTLEQNAIRLSVEAIQGFNGAGMPVRHRVKLRARRRSAGGHKMTSRVLRRQRSERVKLEEVESTEIMRKTEWLTVKGPPERLRIKTHVRVDQECRHRTFPGEFPK